MLRAGRFYFLFVLFLLKSRRVYGAASYDPSLHARARVCFTRTNPEGRRPDRDRISENDNGSMRFRDKRRGAGRSAGLCATEEQNVIIGPTGNANGRSDRGGGGAKADGRRLFCTGEKFPCTRRRLSAPNCQMDDREGVTGR